MANYLQEQYHDRVLDPVAKQIDPGAVMEQATKLYVQLPTRSVASAVAAAVGRVAGTMISLAVSGFGAIAHESERSEMVEQLRVILNVAGRIRTDTARPSPARRATTKVMSKPLQIGRAHV